MGVGGAPRKPARVTVEIEDDGERRQVALRRHGQEWIAGIDGRELAVSVERIGDRWSVLVGPADAGSGRSGIRNSFDVAIEPGTGGSLVVHVNGVAVPLTVADRRGRGRGRDAAADDRPQTIVAPMPGRIVRILVKPGEAVQPRQGLVVVEAMKMENELRAARAGTVTDVRVTEGDSVEANAVLVVLT